VTALLGLATRLKLARLMLITNARSSTGDLAELAAAAFGGGVDLIQLREPQPNPTVHATALAVLERYAGRRGLVSTYATTELAAAAKADVVQLSAMDGSAADAHAVLGQWALVGRSCHSPGQVDDAIAEPGVDFFTVSPVYNAGGVGEAGLSLVAYAAKMAPPASAKPWFAVGGVNIDNLDEVLAAGARRIGVTRAIIGADDQRQAAVQLAQRLIHRWNEDPGMEQVVFNAF
jgi:thiamine-phosphate pyrophosphorylase